MRHAVISADRIERNVQRLPDLPGCWLWTGHLSVNGYGRVNVVTNGKHQSFLAHRVVYASMIGQIPQGMTLDHLCRNRACVNPAHLEPVTMKVNILRGTGASARNRVKTQCPRGHAYTAENIVPSYRNGRIVGRVCRICSVRHHRSPEARARRNAKRKALYWSRVEQERAAARERGRTRIRTSLAHAMPGESGSA